MNRKRAGKYVLAAAFLSFFFLSQGSSAVFCQGKGDAELASFVDELNAFSKEIAGKIEGDPTAAGIDAAQKIFEGKKQSMRERILQFRKREAGVSDAGLKKLRTVVINGTKLLTDAFAKNASLHAENPITFGRFKLLITDYVETFYVGEFDEQIETFIKEFNAVSQEMAEKLGKTRGVKGIDDAQKSFDVKKMFLTDKFSTFKNARGIDVSQETLKKLTDSITSNGKLITDAFSKHAADYADDPEAITKFQKLMKDYTDIFAMM